MKHLPFVAIASTFTIGGVLFLASHSLSDTSANAASHLHAMQVLQPNPDQHRVPPPAVEQQPIVAPPAKPAERSKAEPKAEVSERRPSEHFYRTDAAKRNELCRKLEQRREQLRQERKADRHAHE